MHLGSTTHKVMRTWHGIIRHKLSLTFYGVKWSMRSFNQAVEIKRNFPDTISMAIVNLYWLGLPSLCWQPFELNYRTLFNIVGIQKESQLIFCLKISAALSTNNIVSFYCVQKNGTFRTSISIEYTHHKCAPTRFADATFPFHLITWCSR